MRLTDGTKTVDIKMVSNGIDWTCDFFNAAFLQYNEETDTYKVFNVDYCIEQAHDCLNHVGDFDSDEDTSTFDLSIDEI